MVILTFDSNNTLKHKSKASVFTGEIKLIFWERKECDKDVILTVDDIRPFNRFARLIQRQAYAKYKDISWQKARKNIACERRVYKPTGKPAPYRTSGTSSDNRGNATTGIKCDGRHHGFATTEGVPEKSGRTQSPKRILMTRDKRREQKIKTRA
jgi:hypothetical protein